MPGITTVGNHLLRALPVRAWASLQSHLEVVDMQTGELLLGRGPIDYVYFPISGVVAKSVAMSDGSTVEAGLVGREGVIPICRFLGLSPTPFEVTVQLGGQALRMKADSFDHHVKTNDVLRNTLLQFTAAFVAQVSLSGACKRLHSLKAQYSRLLLMLHDRAAERSFFLKQDSVAHMLGVRRMSITQVAGQLHDEGLISYSRGTLVIEDRRGLQRAACECYARICDVYRTLLPTDH